MENNYCLVRWGVEDEDKERTQFSIALTTWAIFLFSLSANQFTFPFRSVIYYVLFIPHAVLSSVPRFPSSLDEEEKKFWWCICKFILSEARSEQEGGMEQWKTICQTEIQHAPSIIHQNLRFSGDASRERDVVWGAPNKWFINRRNKSSIALGKNCMTKRFPWDLICIMLLRLWRSLFGSARANIIPIKANYKHYLYWWVSWEMQSNVRV